MTHYSAIKIGGGDTSTPLNLQKRINFLKRFITPNQTKLLDCGCGAGEYVQSFIEQFSIDAWGIEYLEEKVSQAKQSNTAANRITQGDIQNIEYLDNTFDIALLNEVLEHVPDEHLALTEVHRVLKKLGLIIIFSPNRWFPFETHGVYMKNSDKKIPPYIPLMPYIPLRLGKQFFHYWARNYWQSELHALVEKAGFKVIEKDFFWQTFENISGSQPLIIRKTKPLLRGMANTFEQTPLIRRFGVSQVVVGKKI